MILHCKAEHSDGDNLTTTLEIKKGYCLVEIVADVDDHAPIGYIMSPEQARTFGTQLIAASWDCDSRVLAALEEASIPT